MAVRSQQEYHEMFLDELDAQAPDLDDRSEGSDNDIVAGIASLAANELGEEIESRFRKTFFKTAHGPEVTGGADDLEDLAVDHFGDSFKRPAAVKSTGIVTFDRANSDAGDVLIDVGTIVKTQMLSSGEAISVEVIAAVTMTGTTINASCRALVAGSDGNVSANSLTVLDTSLSDPSITVSNSDPFAGGADAEDDAQYNETIKELLETLKGATLRAIESKAKTVAGVVYAKAVEFLLYFKEWDIENDEAIGDIQSIPRARVYIADANGNSSPELIAAVKDAVKSVRAGGVQVLIEGMQGVQIDWTGQVTLNPSGPNYASLSIDLTQIVDTMNKYLQDLPGATSFIKAVANTYIMSIWGPSGTNDITAFSTTAPSADVAITSGQKAIPGTVQIGN